MHASRQRWLRWAATAACLLCGAAAAQDSLCEAGEPIVFSCHIGNKTLSLCRPSAPGRQLVYRFGTPNKLDMAYPPPGIDTGGRFEVSDTPLYGGGVTTVAFRRGGYQYQIYSKTGRADDPARTPEFEDGVIVVRNGKPVRHLVCDDGGEGFRQELGFLPRAAR